MTVPEGDGRSGRHGPRTPVDRYRVLGVTFATDLPFAVDVPRSDRAPLFTITMVDELPPGWDPGDRDAVYESEVRLSNGSPTAQLFVVPEGCLLRMGGAGDYCLATDDVRWVPATAQDPRLGGALGAVLAVWLGLRGSPVVHGSAVELGGGAVGFLGAPGAGKSTLSASFVDDGGRLLADDALAIEIHQDRAIAHPGFPQSRLWSDSASFLVPELEDAGALQSRADGKRIVSRLHAATFCDQPRRLDRLYVLVRNQDRSDVEITTFGGTEAVVELFRHSFVVWAARPLGIEPLMFESMSDVAAHVGVARLEYPSGYRRLHEVRDAIAADLAGT